jgi:hypothetical protein
MTDWYDLLAPATGALCWEGEEHPITWRRGRLVLEAHDLARDAALAGLGGERCICLDVHRLWRGRSSDDWSAIRKALFAWMPPPRAASTMSAVRRRQEEMIEAVRSTRVYAPSLPGQRAVAAVVATAVGGDGAVASGLRRGAERRLADDLRTDYNRALLQCLPADLRLRLALGAVLRRSRRPDASSAADAMLDLAALRAKVAPALRDSLAAARPGGSEPTAIGVSCQLVREDEPVAIRGEAMGGVMGGGGSAVVRLPLRWLADVWGPGLAVVDGWFTAAIIERRSRADIVVLAARWEGGPPGPATLHTAQIQLHRPDGGVWRAVPAGRSDASCPNASSRSDRTG